MLAIGFKVKNTVIDNSRSRRYLQLYKLHGHPAEELLHLCFFFLKCHLDFGVSLQTAKVKRSFSLSHEHKLWSLSLTFTVQLQPFTCPTVFGRFLSKFDKQSDILLSCLLLVLVFSFLSNLIPKSNSKTLGSQHQSWRPAAAVG